MASSQSAPKAAAPSDSKTAAAAEKSKETQKPNKVLEEDDEFEDFPAEDWSDNETDGKSGKSKNLWEESWDDDESTDDFASQLRSSRRRREKTSRCHSPFSGPQVFLSFSADRFSISATISSTSCTSRTIVHKGTGQKHDGMHGMDEVLFIATWFKPRLKSTFLLFFE
ncbi:hypothetical protein K440DRAFT_393739 [Wilcoxina mikolae CBS 423.85]|nr:hypothetical protein K440DRAFT_393739 [Wilcoxina mikolae CBS 423.85]